ncbi:hypothetical protein SEA_CHISANAKITSUNE_111 [Gordonia phage ChisanaKitsune]|uniref:Uncharacterized protein n=1 Tax=Gordonia phage ChisanaKitsune TaxID=2871538 RepID=A0AAE8BX34_9CAUD|nr:hypothetical protein PQD15_gp111 [Gordonia phage ChisanaKitsune]QZE10898.1 hypothetical protein SEA_CHISANAKITSUNE_111 [Gordonia phage ChisanaKitsune]
MIISSGSRRHVGTGAAKHSPTDTGCTVTPPRIGTCTQKCLGPSQKGWCSTTTSATM